MEALFIGAQTRSQYARLGGYEIPLVAGAIPPQGRTRDPLRHNYPEVCDSVGDTRK